MKVPVTWKPGAWKRCNVDQLTHVSVKKKLFSMNK
jgi:hypothetical protein